VSVQGINEGDIHIKKGIMMQVNNSREMFYIVERLPRNSDVILGQEWLLQNDCCSEKHTPSTDMTHTNGRQLGYERIYV
jgi:hypothetical protein